MSTPIHTLANRIAVALEMNYAGEFDSTRTQEVVFEVLRWSIIKLSSEYTLSPQEGKYPNADLEKYLEERLSRELGYAIGDNPLAHEIEKDEFKRTVRAYALKVR